MLLFPDHLFLLFKYSIQLNLVCCQNLHICEQLTGQIRNERNRMGTQFLFQISLIDLTNFSPRQTELFHCENNFPKSVN